jgi:hypothetical protein
MHVKFVRKHFISVLWVGCCYIMTRALLTVYVYVYSFWYNAPTLLLTGRQQCRCIVPKTVYTAKRCSWGWVNLSPETCRADLKRSINGICCILLVANFVVLVMQGHTNIKIMGKSIRISNIAETQCFQRTLDSTTVLLILEHFGKIFHLQNPRIKSWTDAAVVFTLICRVVTLMRLKTLHKCEEYVYICT